MAMSHPHRLTDSMAMINMENYKKQIAEQFLNHALEIIYLLTGERYTFMKNPSDSNIHRVSRQVPIKCNDLTLYFTVEEGQYVDEPKEVIMESPQMLRTVEIQTSESAGCCDEHRETRKNVVLPKNTEGKKHSDCAADDDNVVISTEQRKDLRITSRVESVDEDICDNTSTDDANADLQMSGDQPDELSVRRHMQALEQEICGSMSTDISDEAGDVVSNHEKKVLEVEERDDLQINIQSDLCVDISDEAGDVVSNHEKKVLEVEERDDLQINIQSDLCVGLHEESSDAIATHKVEDNARDESGAHQSEIVPGASAGASNH
ncbi:uncharacterized protein LOC128666738 [Bombina bombina]|uniref:uncharacterized protein LOC128666738 n=1 Tax=Bombina bombina TaxID=8345 RepID=UPI00235AB0CF|nr:uncharacterized protein LOC128666738 [Bombina bombina]